MTITADYLDPSTLATLSSLELRARMIVEGLMTGMHRSPYQGISVEFAQHRQYAPGDDIRHLDWKVYGRTDKLYLKQYQKETNLDLLVLVDASGSMGYSSQTGNGWRKYDHAAALAAAITYLALRQQDRVGVALFADQVIQIGRMSNSRDHWRSIIELLSAAHPRVEEDTQPLHDPAQAGRREPGTDLARVFEQVLAKLTQRSLIILISDLFDDPAVVDRALARLHHRRHDLIVLQTLDPAERRFPFRSATDFVGLEREGKLGVDPLALRKAYLQALEHHLNEIEAITRRYHFDHLLLDSSESVGAPLSHFLARRAASTASAAYEKSTARMTILALLPELFVNGGLAVAGAAAVGIPVAIHLLTRLRRQQQPWAAMRFLIEAFRRQRQRLRIEQLLLLLVRCLILVVLGLALAGPFLSGLSRAIGGDTSGRLICLVIDDGLSSQALTADQHTRFDTLLANAGHIVVSLGPGDRVVLWTTARPLTARISPPTADLASVRRTLAALHSRASHSDWPASLAAVNVTLAEQNVDRDRVTIFLLGDFLRRPPWTWIGRRLPVWRPWAAAGRSSSVVPRPRSPIFRWHR